MQGDGIPPSYTLYKYFWNIVDLLYPPQCAGCLPDRCNESAPVYHRARSWSQLKGPLHNAVVKLKYRQDLGLGDVFTHHLAALVKKQEWVIDMIVPVPLGKKRQLKRGYNQAASIARPLSWFLRVTYKPKALRRMQETSSQVGLPTSERERNVVDAFHSKKKMVEGMRILVVDNVMTTGSTLNACTVVLKNANARKIYRLTLSRALDVRNPEQRYSIEV